MKECFSEAKDTASTIIKPADQLSSSDDLDNMLTSSRRFLEDTWQHPDRRTKQVLAVAEGLTVGTIQEIPDQVLNHPLETCGKVAITGVTGVALAGCVAFAPVELAAVAAAGGVLGSAYYLSDLNRRLSQDSQFTSALDKVWQSNDWRQFQEATGPINHAIGTEGFNIGVGLLGGGVGAGATLRAMSALRCRSIIPTSGTSKLPEPSNSLAKRYSKTEFLNQAGPSPDGSTQQQDRPK